MTDSRYDRDDLRALRAHLFRPRGTDDTEDTDDAEDTGRRLYVPREGSNPSVVNVDAATMGQFVAELFGRPE